MRALRYIQAWSLSSYEPWGTLYLLCASVSSYVKWVDNRSFPHQQAGGLAELKAPGLGGPSL